MSSVECPKKERPKNALECPKIVLECPKNVLECPKNVLECTKNVLECPKNVEKKVEKPSRICCPKIITRKNTYKAK